MKAAATHNDSSEPILIGLRSGNRHMGRITVTVGYVSPSHVLWPLSDAPLGLESSVVWVDSLNWISKKRDMFFICHAYVFNFKKYTL